MSTTERWLTIKRRKRGFQRIQKYQMQKEATTCRSRENEQERNYVLRRTHPRLRFRPHCRECKAAGGKLGRGHELEQVRRNGPLGG